MIYFVPSFVNWVSTVELEFLCSDVIGFFDFS